jgi:uncharacterized protein YecT (DUF1311 family)
MHKISIFSLILFSLQALAFEEGDKCSNPKNLPSHFTCFDGEIYDCNNQNQGHMGYAACGSVKVDKLRTDLEVRYKSLLNAYQKPAKKGQDFVFARSSLRKSQKAWEQFIKSDCDLGDSLIGTGNASAGVVTDCYYSHLNARIERLKSLESDLQ